jgi:hypothetical protein
MGLPREVPPKYLHRVPLHLVYPVDRPGTYLVRYTEYRNRPGRAGRTVYLQSDWTAIEILPSTAAQRRAWFQALAASPPDDTVEVLSNFLPSLLAERDEPALRLLARYLESPDSLVRQYVAYALNYFDSGLLQRVTPVPIGNIELNEKMELACPTSSLPSGAQRSSRVGRRRFGGLQISSHTPSGESRTSAPARRPAPLGETA